MSGDERFEDFLRREAAECYNRPPETPRELMWGRVAERLGASREEGDAATGAPTGAPASAASPVAGGPEAWEDPADVLAAASSLYHAPPEPPREEMWDRVAAEWRERRVGPAEAGSGGAGADSDRGGRQVPAWAWGLALAATLLLGVILGRGTLPELGLEEPAAVATDARGPGADETPPSGPDGEGGPEAPGGTEALVGGGPGDAVERAGPGEPAAGGGEDAGGEAPARPGREAGDPSPVRLAAAGEAAGETTAGRPARAAASYRAAAFAHLSRSELFLTGFRADGGDPADQAGSARDLLSDTRLFLDWSRGEDPHLTALLEDLELVLAQIGRLEPGASPGERGLILDGLERRGVISLLRSTVPGPDEGVAALPESGT